MIGASRAGILRKYTTSTPPQQDYDPYFDYNLIQHTFDNTLNMPTGIVGVTVDPQGSVTTTNSESKFGGYSAYFDGTAGIYYTNGSYEDAHHLQHGPFTIEGFIKVNNASTTKVIFGDWRIDYRLSYMVYVYSDGIGFCYSTDGQWTPSNDWTISCTHGEWMHFAFVRNSSGILSGYVNGEKTEFTNTEADILYYHLDNYPHLAKSPVADSFDGYIDDFRFTKGIARYTDNFTVPTSALPTSSGYSSAWNPSYIETSLWLDAEDESTLTKSSNLVSQWSDKSGNNSHVYQDTENNKPTYSTCSWDGDLHCLSFTGSHNLTSTKTMLDYHHKDYMYCFMVGNISQNSNYDSYPYFCDAFFGDTAGCNAIYVRTTNKLGVYAYDGDVRNIEITHNTNTPFIISMSHSVDKLRFILNGNISSVNSTTEFSNYIMYSITANLYIGCNYFGFGYLNGEIGELIFIKNPITPRIQQKIEGYLAHKWSLTSNLPESHPYKNSPPSR